jgi:hypothetical protein
MSIDTIASKELKAEENYNEILRQEQEMKEKEAHHIFHQGINRQYNSNPATDLCLVEKLTEYVVQVFKYENSLTIEQKINFTSLLIYYRCFIDLEEFYEEECHLSLVKWIYSNLDSFKSEKEDDFIFHLLYNIIIIFEVLPINVKDLFDLKIFDKLNKIRKLFKNKNLYIFSHLDNLLNYWTTFCTENCFRKRSRNEIVEFPDDHAHSKKKGNYIFNFLK